MTLTTQAGKDDVIIRSGFAVRGYGVVATLAAALIGSIVAGFSQPFVIAAETDRADWVAQLRILDPENDGYVRSEYSHFYRISTD